MNKTEPRSWECQVLEGQRCLDGLTEPGAEQLFTSQQLSKLPRVVTSAAERTTALRLGALLSLLSPGFSQREDCARAETFDKFEPFIRVVDQLLPQAELQPLVHNAATSK